jgi:tetratricopeptide (TPR) repeat protein
MTRPKTARPEMRTIVFVDAVNFTSELKEHGRAAIAPKIAKLQEFAEFFFVYKLKGNLIGKLGDGFLLLCPPAPPEVIAEALSCQSFVDAYNVGKNEPDLLNTRIAIHYGLIAPPEGGNYIDTNLNLTARLEGATPPNCICISATLYDIVVDALKELAFEELKSDFKGLGENKYYVVGDPNGRLAAPSRREARLSYYFSTLSALLESENWEAVKTTCEQALIDFSGNPEFISQLASSLFELEDYPGAIRAYEQCVAKNYDVADSLLYIGFAYRRMGQGAQALAVFTEATERGDKPFHALDAIADIYFERNDYDNAEKWARKSLKVNRHFLFPMATLIAIHLFRGDEETPLRILKGVEPHRRSYLREDIETRCKMIGMRGFNRILDGLFNAAQAKSERQVQNRKAGRSKSP